MWPNNNILTDQILYIRELQTMLRKLAFYYPEIPLVNPDGIFGSETTRAAAAFQRLFGIPVTGQVDRRTWDTLTNEYRRLIAFEDPPAPLFLFPSRETVLTADDTGDAVYALQIILNALARRYNNITPFPLTGVMDTATTQAIRELKRYLGLPDNGDVDRETWDRLVGLYNTL